MAVSGSVRRSGAGSRRWLAAIAVLFVVDRLALWAAGMGFDAAALHPRVAADAQWQLLGPHLLQHHLLASLWNLASQPPLYNLVVGLVLRLPLSAQVPVVAVCWSALGLLLVCTAFLLMVALDVPIRVAGLVVLVLLVANPDVAMYERWLFYAEPTAASLTLCAYGGVRFLQDRRRRWGVCFFAAGAFVVLLNSTYQWAWWLVLAIPVVVVLRRQWRMVVVCAALPALAVTVWVVKDAVLFGSPATSSWAGMNLATSTLQMQPPQVLHALVRRKVLGPLALVPPFAPVSAYSPRFFAAPPPGHQALTERVESNGETNFDNRVYLAVSKAYLGQDLRFIAADPGRYASDIGRAVALWNVPGDDYPFVASLRAPVAGYARVFDALVLWQPSGDPTAGLVAEFGHRAPSPLDISWLSVIVTALAIVGAPVVAWRRRRDEPLVAAGLCLLWWTSTFAFVVTSLFEVGENNRFAAEVGPLPLVAATVVAVAVWRAAVPWRRRRSATLRDDRPPVLPGAGLREP